MEANQHEKRSKDCFCSIHFCSIAPFPPHFCCSSALSLHSRQRRLALADVTGNGHNELIYATFDGAVRCQDLTTGQLLWDVPIYAFPFSLKARDVDNNGKAEVFVAAADGGLYAITSDGQLAWTFRSKLPLYAVDVGDIAVGGGLEVATGGMDGQVYVLSNLGQLLAQDKVSRFVHRLAVLIMDGHVAYLGSSPNGDETVYRIDMKKDWLNQIKQLQRQGQIRTIGDNLARLRQQVLAYQGKPNSQHVYDIRYETRKLSVTKVAKRQFALEMQKWFKQILPYPNLRLTFLMKVMEQETPVLRSNHRLLHNPLDKYLHLNQNHIQGYSEKTQ